MLLAGQYDGQYLDAAWDERCREYVTAACGPNSGCSPQAITAFFLAFMMRLIRRQLQQLLSNDDLDLVFNSCVPVDQREKPIVYAAFEQSLAVAQEIERTRRDVEPLRAWLDAATELWESVRYAQDDDANRVFLVPEAAAASAGYIASIRRATGLHAIVDIGAGTTDVSIFRLAIARKTGETVYWYAGRSIPMGAARLEARAAETLIAAGLRSVSQSEVVTALDGRGRFASACSPVIRDELTRIWNGTNKAWAEAYGQESRESEWRRTVKVFITGGGALIPAARNVFAKAWIERFGPYECSAIPTPEHFDSAEVRIRYPRMCVAYGLAIPLPEMGHQVRPTALQRSSNHVSARGDGVIPQAREEVDELIPKPGWV